jgi:hypothetical protein
LLLKLVLDSRAIGLGCTATEILYVKLRHRTILAYIQLRMSRVTGVASLKSCRLPMLRSV